jgi:GT2 family glycosyltransferase
VDKRKFKPNNLNMALIAMAVYSTEENKKDEYLLKTLSSLANTVDFTKHRLMLSVNGKTDSTDGIIDAYKSIISKVIYNDTNLGTAEAINKIWFHRQPGEHAIKMDDDVVIHQAGWVDLMEEAISREPLIGIIGLKRKDLAQTPWNAQWPSELVMLPHEPYQRWICVERTADVMGTCTMFNSALLDKIGYLWQPSLYGYDDVMACHRSHLAGHYNCFLNHIEIDHIDPGGTPYQQWKEKHSGEVTRKASLVLAEYERKETSIYYNPFI